MAITITGDAATFDGSVFRQVMQFEITGDVDSEALRHLFAEAQDAFRETIEGAELASYVWPPSTVQALPAAGSGGLLDWSRGGFICATTGVR